LTTLTSARHHPDMSDGHRLVTLLQPGDPAPVVLRNGDAVAPVLVVADHAGRAVPQALHLLGLPERELWRHIAWDVGALDLATGLADQLGAPMVASTYSRLVIDCNRYPADPMSIAPASDNCDVPGNAEIDVIQRERRAQEIFRPYHDAIAYALEGAVARGTPPLLLAVHTMTPRMAGRDRPQHVTVCWTLDSHLPNRALGALRRQEGLVVGDNDPYAVDLGVDYTVPEHALRRGLPYLMLEIRQDLVATPADAALWVERLVPVVREVLADAGCMAPRRVWP
jgi:predicted N-formylglutamate amidohydrolase